MNKKYIFLVIGLLVLSLAAGILIGKWKSPSAEKDAVPSPPTYDNGGDTAQSSINQPPLIQPDVTAYIQQLLKEKPNNAKTFAEVGDIYFDQRKFNEAIEYYKKTIAMEPDDVDSYNDIGLAYHYIGKSDEGLKYVEEGIKKNPNYQRAWLTKGFILAVKGSIGEARASWEKAYNIDQNSDIGKSAASFLEQYSGTGTAATR